MAPGRDVVAAAPTSVGKAVPSSPSAHSANAPTHGRHGRFEVLPPTTHWTPGAAILTIIGLAIGFLALGINGQTGWRFGTTPLAAWTFAGLSIAADALVMTLPAAAVALWHARQRLLAFTAWLLAGMALTIAALASLGFAELHFADTAASRQAIVTTASTLADQRTARIAAAERAVAIATKAREGECAIRGPRCRDREAEERTTLTTLASVLATPAPAAAPIADPDPQVTAALRLVTWLGLNLTAADVVNLRLILMATLPNIAGLVLAFGVALRRR